MKKNEVLETYKHDFSDPETVSMGLEEIEFLAKNDPQEFQNLIDLFNSIERIHIKLMLSEILISLNYMPVKQFFIDLVFDDENKLQVEYGCPGWSYEHDKIVAAGRLTFMGDIRGKHFFEKIINNVDQDKLEWIIIELYEKTTPERSSISSLECLLELADKYERIAKEIDREEVEKLLKRLRAGEKVVWERPYWD
jgi:hypothetical protein